MARSPNPAVYQRWSRLIERHQQSDLTIAGFCGQNGISTASFYQWRRRIRNHAEPPGEFLAVQVSDRGAACDVKVRFPCGTQIELNAGDTESLRLVVDRLAPRDAEANP